MQVLNLSGLESITECANGERLIKGVFDGVRVEQTLPAVLNPGFWAFDSSISSFVFIQLNEAYKFAGID